jgi:hypothetical protein
MDTFFKTLTKLASSLELSLANQKTTGPIYRNFHEREKNLARLASGFAFLLANPEFYSHLASWRVVIRSPGDIK